MNLRQIVLDTETTGLMVDQGHRIIEVGCLEMLNRRQSGSHFWHYLNPDREIDPGAMEVHGITNEMVADKPRFHQVARELFDYLQGAELIIHNADFDLGFLDREFSRCGIDTPLRSVCSVIDTYVLARRLHPGQRANLDALCRRYGVDNTNRKFHGALLDAQLLAEVYLAMTGGQSHLVLDGQVKADAPRDNRLMASLQLLAADKPGVVLRAGEGETEAHIERLKAIRKKAGKCLWPDDPMAAV